MTDAVMKKRFHDLLSGIDPSVHLHNSIGTYKEKTLHLFLKKFFEPDEDFHEVSFGPYVADIKNSQGIIEIQTAGFSSASARWSFFAEENPVAVIYPIAGIKYVAWIDPEDGSVSEKHRSPKKGLPIHILPELLRVRELFGHPNITFRCVLMELTEYRLKDGWGNEGKRGSHRYDMIPEGLIDIVDIRNAADVSALLPFDDDVEFTSTEFRRACGISPRAQRDISMSLKFLLSIGVIAKSGKRKNAFLYKKCSQNEISRE